MVKLNWRFFSEAADCSRFGDLHGSALGGRLCFGVRGVRRADGIGGDGGECRVAVVENLE